MELRPYQAEAVEAVLAEWDAGKRATLVHLATGLGKTVLASELVRRRTDSGRVLWLAHREELIEQAAQALEAVGLSTQIEKAEQRANAGRTALGAHPSDVVVASVQTLHKDRRTRFGSQGFGTIVVDECFPAGTLIGGKRIECLRAGDVVPSYDETSGRACFRRVVAQWSRTPTSMVRVHTEAGPIACTPNHPLLTKRGWVPAGQLRNGDEVRHEAQLPQRMRPMRTGQRYKSVEGNAAVLRGVQGGEETRTAGSECMERDVSPVCEAAPATREESIGGSGPGASLLLAGLPTSGAPRAVLTNDEQDEPPIRFGTDAEAESDAAYRNAGTTERNASAYGARAKEARRKRPPALKTASQDGGSTWTRVAHGMGGANEDGQGKRLPDTLQDRHRASGTDGRNRGRWYVARGAHTAEDGCEEGRVSGFARVDRVEVLEPGRDGTFGGVCPDGCVYNLEVEGTHTYFADGFVAHNCHHAAARTYRDIIGYYDGAVVLGLTATPDRGDGVGLQGIFDSVAYRYDIADGVDDGWLVPVHQRQVECADIDLSDVQTRQGDLAPGDLERVLSVDKVLHQMARPLADMQRPTLVFTAGVEQAHSLADVIANYDGVGSEQVAAIDGSTPRESRHYLLRRFREGDIRYLINCQVLTEGFDAPTASCVAVARPTKSRALYTQMVGRGTRTLPGVIEGLETADKRKAAIAASAKPNMMILDFVGNAGRHKLVSPMDVLSGKPLPDEVEKDAKERAQQGQDVRQAIQDAEEAAEERQRKEEERRRAQAQVQANVAYTTREVDPFTFTQTEAGPRATEKQLQALDKMGVRVDKTPSRREASKMINRVKERREKGLCTVKMARKLAEFGLDTELRFDDAKKVLDAIAATGWKRAPEWAHEQYGRSRESTAA